MVMSPAGDGDGDPRAVDAGVVQRVDVVDGGEVAGGQVMGAPPLYWGTLSVGSGQVRLVKRSAPVWFALSGMLFRLTTPATSGASSAGMLGSAALAWRFTPCTM